MNGTSKNGRISRWGMGLAVLGFAGVVSACGTGGNSAASLSSKPSAAASTPSSHGSSSSAGSSAPADTAKINAVGAENEYGNVISQIGGQYVSVSSIMSNPTTDPHTYEASTKDASLIAQATLVVQNGVGYDGFMNKLEAASPNPNRQVIVAAQVMGYPSNLKNPHLWYKPGVMQQVAQKIEQELAKQQPAHAAYFQSQLQQFDASLSPWTQELSQLKQDFPNAPVAVTEPVADYLLEAAGMKVMTPWAFQAAVMNGVDPSPQNVQIQDQLITGHKVKVLLYNQQAVDSVTVQLLKLAKQNNIPVVGVYETMPTDKTYQTWMETETTALQQALKNGKSTVTLQ